jgi:putative DNA primase/helicase
MSEPIDKVRETLAQAEDVSPDPEAQVEHGPQEDPQDPGFAPDAGPPHDPDGHPDDDDLRAPEGATFPLNDIGNGKRFALYFGDDVMHVPRVGWFLWTGKVWKKDDDEVAVRRRAQQIPAKILTEARHLAYDDWEVQTMAEEPVTRAALAVLDAIKPGDLTEEQRLELVKLEERMARINSIKSRFQHRKKKHRDYSLSSGNSAKLSNMVLEAKVNLSRDLPQLDAEALAINTESGVLRFTVEGGPGTGFSRTAALSLHPHNRDDLITKIMPVTYDPAAACPEFETFVKRVLPDAEIRRFVQRWLGLSMTSVIEQHLAFFYGSGANGKSVLVDTIARLMGTYAATAKIESLTGTNKRGGGDATPDLIPLMGARMVRASEPEEGERLREAEIKSMTSGEPFLVRALHSDFVEFKPLFKLTISGNHKPEIRGTDDGIWRRVMLVPFDVQIPEEERREFEEFVGALLAEGSGILNWLIEGLLDYLESGLRIPAAIADATRSYREESDPMQVFLDQCCIVTGSETDFTTTRELVDAFQFWIEESGQSRWRDRTVTVRLKDKAGRWRDPRTGKTFDAAKRSVAGYIGLDLTDMFRSRMREARSAATSSPDARSRKDIPDPEF